MVALEELVRELGGSLQAPASGQTNDVLDVQIDSRSVGAGDLFAALPGRAADGARFAH
jgi:UDP-N-acetylmuramoyl-L-alanyl-D-glutamate--2,6-diaminopimelate ligase